MNKPKLNIGDVVLFSVALSDVKESFKVADIVESDYILENLDGFGAMISYPIRLFDSLIELKYVEVIKRENGLTRALKRILKYGKKTKV